VRDDLLALALDVGRGDLTLRAIGEKRARPIDPVYRGHEGLRKFERDFRGAWESLSVVVDELHDQGDKVAVLGTFEARGRDGMTVSRRIVRMDSSVATAVH